jgi:O-antigen ligase
LAGSNLHFSIFIFQFAIPRLMDRAIRVTLLITIAFTALAFGTVEAWSVAIFELLVVVIMLLWVVKSLAERRLEINIPKTALPIIGLVIYGIIQGLGFRDSTGQVRSLSMDVESTRAAVTVIFFMLVCFLASATFFASPERTRTVSTFLVVFGAALAVFSLVQHFTWDGGLYWFRRIPLEGFGPFVNRDHFSGYMEMLAPIPIGLIVARAVPRAQWPLYGFAAVLMGVSILASLSRGGILSFTAGLGFIAVAGRRWRLRRPESQRTAGALLRRGGAVVTIVAAIGIGMLWIGAGPLINRAAFSLDQLKTEETPSSYPGREGIWKDTWAMIRANPIFGVGAGAYRTVVPIYSHYDDSYIVAQSHSDYLQVLADCGIIGAALTVWFVFAVWRDITAALGPHASSVPRSLGAHPSSVPGLVLRDARWASPQAGIALGGGAAIFAMLVHSLFDFNLQIPSNALLFLVITAVVSAIRLAASRGTQRRQAEYRQGAKDAKKIGVAV